MLSLLKYNIFFEFMTNIIIFLNRKLKQQKQKCSISHIF
jgi:hypothetical protein